MAKTSVAAARRTCFPAGFRGCRLQSRSSAAAAIELAFAACAIEEGWIPPAIGAGPVDPKIQVMIPTERTTGDFRRVLSNSFAFGGNNVSLLVARP